VDIDIQPIIDDARSTARPALHPRCKLRSDDR